MDLGGRTGTTRTRSLPRADRVTGAPRITVDPDSGLAPWRQVHDQIRWLVGDGRLPAGARLPTVRQLARDLGLSPGTVARAYRELETAGVLSTAGRNGTEVVGPPRNGPDLPSLTSAASGYAAAARATGADLQHAVAAVIAAFDERGAGGTTRRDPADDRGVRSWNVS
jgi:GntR family transcriptional regulator